jgi:hypothetical protein
MGYVIVWLSGGWSAVIVVFVSMCRGEPLRPSRSKGLVCDARVRRVGVSRRARLAPWNR